MGSTLSAGPEAACTAATINVLKQPCARQPGLATAREGRSSAEIQTALDEWRRGDGRVTAEQRRNTPGVAVATTPLPHVVGPWLSAHMSDGQGAPNPGQVAERLYGRRVSSFRELREAFWQAVAETFGLAGEFRSQNLRLMANGNAPYPPRSEQVVIGTTGEASRRPWELHHDPAIG